MVTTQTFWELCEPSGFLWCNLIRISSKAPLETCRCDFWMGYVGFRSYSLQNASIWKINTKPGFLGTLQPVEIHILASLLEILSSPYLPTTGSTHLRRRQCLPQLTNTEVFNSTQLRSCEVSSRCLNPYSLCQGEFAFSDTQKQIF